MWARNDSGHSGCFSPCFVKHDPLKGRTIRLYLNAARYMMFAWVWLAVLCVWMKANLRRVWHGGFCASGFLSVTLFFASSSGFWKDISISRRLIRITVNISITMIVCTREQLPVFLLLEIWKMPSFSFKNSLLIRAIYFSSAILSRNWMTLRSFVGARLIDFNALRFKYTWMNNGYLFLICDIV